MIFYVYLNILEAKAPNRGSEISRNQVAFMQVYHFIAKKKPSNPSVHTTDLIALFP